LIIYPQISQISQIKEQKDNLLLACHGLNFNAKSKGF